MNLYEIRNHLANGKTIFDLPLKVTFYARVSTDKYEQLNSLDNQVNYYTNYIKKNSNWSYVKGYIDEGISGTSVNNRYSFKKMILDAKNGKFDLIITKEISRFARDTLDSISYTRKLLEYNVGVLFEYDHINTFNSDSELRLTIMSSIAQEEVRKLSERVKFGFQRSIESGKVLGNNNILGYKKDNCRLVIIPKEAEVVKEIFNMYVNDHIGMKSIGIKLSQKGIFNKNKKPFSQSSIKYILTNPKYKGFYCGNKTRVIDYHTKKKVNINKEDQKIYEDTKNIPPIVSKYIWDKAQEIINSKSNLSQNKKIYQNRYPLSGKIICKKHNVTYHRKVYISSGIKKRKIITWRCSNYLKYNKKACDGPILYEDILKDLTFKFILKKVYNPSLINNLIEEYKLINDNNNFNEKKNKKKTLENLENTKIKILDLLIKNIITEDDFKIKLDEISGSINKIKNEINDMEKSFDSNLECIIRKNIKEKILLNSVDDLIYNFLLKIEVYENNIKIILKTGDEISILFNNLKHPFCNNYSYD